jgi:hypothetical protein
MSELLHTFRRKSPREKAATLVVTLLVLTLLSAISVAFIQSVSMERSAARSALNRYQSELAADAGFAYAFRYLGALAANDHYIIYANPNGQLFFGNGANQTTGNFSYTPLFSASTNLSLNATTINATAIVTSGVPSVTVPSPTIFTNTLAGGVTVTSPPISWINITSTNQSGQVVTNSRFAFWVEDLAGKVDVSVAGTNHSSPSARRPTGTNASELALWSIFDATATIAVSNAATTLAQQQTNLFTPATARAATPGVTTNHLASLASRLRHDTNEPELIPYGLGYANQGQPKVNLNSANLNSIAAAISTNLASFGSRGGALSPGLYITNIAANIIDYIDADTTPTAGAGYRGVEAIPFLNERGTWYTLLSTNFVAGNFTANLTTLDYFEFWNPHNRPTPAGFLTIQFTNNAPIQYGGGTTNLNFSTNYVLNLPAMNPGAYFVASSPVNTNSVRFATAFAPAGVMQVLAGTNVSYGMIWSGSFYDRGRGTLLSTTTIPLGQSRFIVNPPSLGTKDPPTGTANNSYFNSIGDPRITFYMTNSSGPLVQQQTSWPNANTSFGGRNFQSGNTGRLSSEVFMTNWPDLGLNGGIRGTPASNTNTPPSLGAFGATGQTNFAPAVANPNTTGRMERITELGNIFDPLQWGETFQSIEWPNEPAAWTNLTAAASPNSRYGGGSTLRIGRPEFTRFTNASALTNTRAASLLDIFAVGQTNNSSQVINTVAGKININTASSNALRALAAGVTTPSDPGLAPGGTNFAPSASAINTFVSAVINTRNTRRPFYSTAELANLASNLTPTAWPGSAVFGNRSLMGITAANDRGTEEWFAKVYPLATVRSRNFLVHVVGQSGDITSRKTFQIHLRPQRNAGLTTNSLPENVGKWDL